jgi:hypothetical protein
VLPDLKHEKEENFTSFKPEFSKREFQKGVYKPQVMCQPVITRGQPTVDKPAGEKDELQIMIQMNGFKTYSYTQTDYTLMNLTAKAIGIALLKVKAERIMNDTLSKTQGNLDCCKSNVQ